MGVSKNAIPSGDPNEGIATQWAVWTDAKLTGPRTQGTLHGYKATHDRKRHLNRPPSPPAPRRPPPRNPPAGYTSAAAPHSTATRPFPLPRPPHQARPHPVILDIP